MRFYYNKKELSNNPCVYKVDQWKLTLRTDFRIELFELWRDGEVDKVEQKLLENGLGPGAVGPEFGRTLITSFKNSGYPVHKSDELIFCPDRLKEHPLVKTGKFEQTERGGKLRITKSFEKELFSRFPEISVEEGMRMAGLDPVDVGYQRINRIQKEFEERANRMYAAEHPDIECPDITGSLEREGFSGIERGQSLLMKHPYVQDYDGNTVTLTESFYNETYLLAGIGIDRILGVYELPAEQFDERRKLAISAKLFNWSPSDNRADESDEMVHRIQCERLQLLSECVASNFTQLRDLMPDMGISRKRRLAEWIDSLPRDPWGYYTVRRILGIIGLSKSTYYELLHNENYGTSERRRAMRDDEDILLVRQVAEYKGYKKGYRQISMMMQEDTESAPGALSDA